MSFSTEFTGDDSVNANIAAEVGREIQIKLDGQPVTSTMDVKPRYKSCRHPERFPWSARLTEVVQPTDHFRPAGYDS